MSFTLPDHWVWDFWLADDGEQFHLYYLFAPRSLGDESLRHRNARIGRATSRDLVSWVDHGEVLAPGAAGSLDETATWTGSVVRASDGEWRMFYTGSRFLAPDSTTNVEQIGLAVSDDLVVWRKRDDVLVSADPRWYERLEDGTWREEAWRDPWVYSDGERWHMLVTARANEGDALDRGVIAHATSDDLESWTVQPPVSAPGAGFLHLEVPQLVEHEGRYVLLFSCDTPHLAVDRRKRGETGGIWAVDAPSATGPFAVERAVRIADERYYSGRLIRDHDGAWLLLAFENVGEGGDFIGRLSDPMPVTWTDDGVLQLETQGARS